MKKYIITEIDDNQDIKDVSKNEELMKIYNTIKRELIKGCNKFATSGILQKTVRQGKNNLARLLGVSESDIRLTDIQVESGLEPWRSAYLFAVDPVSMKPNISFINSRFPSFDDFCDRINEVFKTARNVPSDFHSLAEELNIVKIMSVAETSCPITCIFAVDGMNKQFKYSQGDYKGLSSVHETLDLMVLDQIPKRLKQLMYCEDSFGK